MFHVVNTVVLKIVTSADFKWFVWLTGSSVCQDNPISRWLCAVQEHVSTVEASISPGDDHYLQYVFFQNTWPSSCCRKRQTLRLCFVSATFDPVVCVASLFSHWATSRLPVSRSATVLCGSLRFTRSTFVLGSSARAPSVVALLNSQKTGSFLYSIY